MKILVLCVDRDDDLGTKAGVSGPVIGRQENLDAAVAMGLADPEEVDTNTILSALQLYDDLIKRGMDAEVATISGDTHVGFRSDLILTTQLENVLEVVKPDRAILVSDGAEDESIYHVVSSRIKIDSAKRVYVKQSKSIEGTYYMIVKTLQDEKMRRRWIVPVSLVLIIGGLISLATKLYQFAEGDYQDIALVSQMTLGVIATVLGVYLVGWAYHWAERFSERMHRTRRSLRQGSLVIPFGMFGLVIAVIGLIIGYDMSLAYSEALLPHERSVAISILIFASGAVWFAVFGVFIYETGKSLTEYNLTDKIRWSFIVMMVSVLATGFVVQGAIDALLLFVGYGDYSSVAVVAEIVTGIMIAVFGSVLNASLRSETSKQKEAAPEGG